MNNKRIAKKIRDAVKILDKRGAWCTEQHAEDENGCGVDPLDDAAVKFCAEGALCRAFNIRGDMLSNLSRQKEIGKAINILNEASGGSLWNFNDNSKSKQRVINLLNKVANKLENGK